MKNNPKVPATSKMGADAENIKQHVTKQRN